MKVSRRDHQAPRVSFSVRDAVYFFANSPDNPDSMVMCRGYIARTPTTESKCYKVIVCEVSLAQSSSTTPEQQHAMATHLLGKKIPREEKQLHAVLGGMFGQVYLSAPWARLSDVEQQKVVNQIKKSRGKKD